MHIIDEVLEPLTAKSGDSETISNPDALKFLQQAEQLNLDNFNVRTYRNQVTLAKKESVFKSPGTHTFLLPVDEGFKVGFYLIIIS